MKLPPQFGKRPRNRLRKQTEFNRYKTAQQEKRARERDREEGTGLPWGVYAGDDGHQHVAPINDLRPHDIDKECWCFPFMHGETVVHNSMDKRECIERGESRRQ